MQVDSTPKESRPSAGAIARWVLLRGSLFYFGVLVLLVVLETSMVFPAPASDAIRGSAQTQALGGEAWERQTRSGNVVHGAYFPHEDPRFTLAYFHGNAEDVATSQAWLRELGNVLSANVMVFDYRGYGQSLGTPREAGLIDDGVAAIDWLVERTGQTSEEMLYLGLSLGGGVAVQVAERRPPSGLILVSTFDSLARVGQGHFPWLPVRWMMRNRFDSAAVLARLDVPLLQIHGDRDRIVPLVRGQTLFEAARTQHKHWITAQGFGHNDLPLGNWASEITRFGWQPKGRGQPSDQAP